jgi:hypothetical protein
MCAALKISILDTCIFRALMMLLTTSKRAANYCAASNILQRNFNPVSRITFMYSPQLSAYCYLAFKMYFMTFIVNDALLRCGQPVNFEKSMVCLIQSAKGIYDENAELFFLD